MNGDLGQLLVSQIREMNKKGIESATWETADLMYLVGWIEALERDKKILEEGIDRALERTNKIIAYLSGEE